MMHRRSATAPVAARLVPGQPIPRATRATEWIELGRALNAEVRARYHLGASVHTVAVGWTSVPGLEAQRFVGGSRRVRERSLLPLPTPHIDSPRAGALFVDHAEQDVANAFIDAADAAGLRGDLDGEALWIYVTHARGPCTACLQGLSNRQVAPGVLARLSLRYPGLTVLLTWETARGKLGSLLVQGGQRCN